MSTRDLRALAWLQWRLTVNSVKGARGRGELERLSRIAEVAAPVLLGVTLVPAALVGTVAGSVVGWLLARSPSEMPMVELLFGVVLMVPFVWVLIRSFALVAQGRVERADLLRLLPIPLSLLRHLELLRAIMDPVFIVFTPALLAVGAGALVGGRPLLALLATVAGLAFLLLLACVSSLLSLTVQLVLRDRRRGELAALAFILVVSAIGWLPQLFVHRADSRAAPRLVRPRPAERPAEPGPTTVSTPSAVLRVLPPFQYARAVVAGASAQWGTALLPLFSLVGLGCVAYVLSIPLHRRLLETPAGSRGTAGGTVDASTAEIPLVSRTVTAVAAVQLRTFTRTVRGKMAVLFPPFTGVLAAVMFTRGGADVPSLFASAYFAPAFVVLMCITNLNVLTCNQFAAGGSGFILELLLPVDERALLRGRALASALLCGASLAAALLLLVVVLPRASLATTAAMFLGGLATHVAMAPAVALLSALLPKAADLSRIGRAGQPHPLANFLGLLCGCVVALPPAVCIALAVLVLKASWLAPVLAAAWLLVVTLVAWAVLPLVERVVAARRENLALVAVGR